MHNLNVSQDVSRTCPFAPSVVHADQVCEQPCEWMSRNGCWLWKRGSKQWTTRATDFTNALRSIVNTTVLPRVVGAFVARPLSEGLVGVVCNDHLHHARQTMKGGECGGNTHANQRRPVRAFHLTQHRISPPRRRRTRTRLPWLSHPHCRRICAGLHSTTPRATNTSWAGR